DGELGNLLGERRARVAAPCREPFARRDGIARFQRFADSGEGVAEVTKSDQYIEDRDVPQQAEQRMQLVQPPVDAGGEQDRRAERQQRRRRALLRGTGVETPLQPPRVTAERTLNITAPGKAPPL